MVSVGFQYRQSNITQSICLTATCTFASANLILHVWQLDEFGTENQFVSSWERGEQSIQYGHPHPQTHGFFQPIECNPTLQIG